MSNNIPELSPSDDGELLEMESITGKENNMIAKLIGKMVLLVLVVWIGISAVLYALYTIGEVGTSVVYGSWLGITWLICLTTGAIVIMNKIGELISD